MSRLSALATPATAVHENEEPFVQGKGTENDPYIITTAKQLNHMRSHLGDGYYYELANEIDLSGFIANDEDGTSGWEPIGGNGNRFTVTFDGNEHKITGLWINRSSTFFVGLFGYSEGTIQNLGVEIDNSKGGVNGYFFTGGLVGYSSGGIENSYATGSVTGGYFNTGGLVGLVRGSITSSYFNTQTTVYPGVGFGDGSGVTGLTTAEMVRRYTIRRYVRP